VNSRTRNNVVILVLVILLPIVAILHLFSGDISIDFSEFYGAMTHFNSESTNQIIVKEFRFPRLVMGVIAGGGLSIAGLLMQTLFNNPLAGPNILGINSGSSLFVAFSLMSGIPFFNSDFGTIISALIGAFAFGLVILAFSMVVKSHVSLLLIGIMLGSFTGAFVSILQSISNPEDLKMYIMWAMGSLQQVEFSQLPIILIFFIIGIIACLFVVKSLNALVLGESQALMLGIKVKYIRIILIAITAVLTGLITAFCGPIAFVGLAVPNLVKLLFKTQSHQTLLIGCLLTGSVFLLVCDIFVQLLESTIHIPINALTSIIGAPFVIVIVLKRLA
jgi:iron complex transport system permease protein